MKRQFYFEHSDSEVCYRADYFLEQYEEVKVFEAIPERIPGVFWCKEHLFCGDNSADTCGKHQCEQYDPRNGKNGRCRFHCIELYTHGNPVTLKRKGGDNENQSKEDRSDKKGRPE